jgi:hypothetical protein
LKKENKMEKLQVKTTLKHKDCILAMARKYGNHQTPRFYREKCREEFGIDPSPSTVTKTVGPMYDRLQHKNNSHITKAAKDFFQLCQGNYPLALNILNRVGHDSSII